MNTYHYQVFCVVLFFTSISSYKLINKSGRDNDMNRNNRYENSFRQEENDKSRDFSRRRESEGHRDGLESIGINLDDLEDAKQHMMDEIKDIKTSLRKKFQSFFNQPEAQLKKKEFCPVYMSNGADWRKMIRDTLVGARNIADPLLGPNSWYTKEKDEEYMSTTEPTMDYTKSSTSEYDSPQRPTDSPIQYRRERNWEYKYAWERSLPDTKRNDIHFETLTEVFKEYCNIRD